jgi:hypothetical protein
MISTRGQQDNRLEASSARNVELGLFATVPLHPDVRTWDRAKVSGGKCHNRL